MKKLVPTILRRAGLFHAWRYAQRRKISILMVHGVMDYRAPTSWQPLWDRVDTAHFEHVLGVLREYYTFVPLREAIEMLSGKRAVHPHSMVLTFDDGYRNNFTHALPIMERLGIPATFYVCTGMLETLNPFWIDRLDYAIQHLEPRPHTFEFKGQSVTLDFANRKTLTKTCHRLRVAIKNAHEGDFETFIEEFASALEAQSGANVKTIMHDDPWTSLMSWQSAREAQRKGIEIDSHTVDHVRLGFADRATALAQLAESRSHIRDRTGIESRSIAYPNGSYTRETAALAAQAGYDCGITTDVGLNAVGDDLFALRRISLPWDRSPDHILAAASGLKLALNRRFARH